MSSVLHFTPPFTRLFRTTAFRLSLAFSAPFALAAAIAIAYIYWNTNVLLARQLSDAVDAELRGLAEQYRSGGLPQLGQTIAERSATPGASLYLLTDPEGRWIAGNLKTITSELWNAPGWVQFNYRRPAPGGFETRLAVASVFRLPEGFRLIVGRDIEDRREFERVVRSAFLWGLGLMALAGVVGGALISRRILQRIDAITGASQTIMAGDLTRRIPLTGSGDELDRLSDNLNAMLERIEELMRGLKEVSDNIAHDLKTPLNRLRNRVEAALRDPRGGAVYRDALQETIEEADELIRTFDALLMIARMEAGARSGSYGPFDLCAAVADVAELYEPLAEEHGLRIVTRCKGELAVEGERQLIAQAVANLIDNAIKYAAPAPETRLRPPFATAASSSSEVEIDVAARDGVAEISVADHGPGVPPSERERVLKRFVRLEASRSRPGSGLGLSLVAAAARLHGGSVRLDDNTPGLRVTLAIRRERKSAAPTPIEPVVAP
jgi:signal transduction histidine kinase